MRAGDEWGWGEGGSEGVWATEGAGGRAGRRVGVRKARGRLEGGRGWKRG